MAFDLLFLNGKIGAQTPVGYSDGQRARCRERQGAGDKGFVWGGLKVRGWAYQSGVQLGRAGRGSCSISSQVFDGDQL
jgi:hypothetical protein